MSSATGAGPEGPAAVWEAEGATRAFEQGAGPSRVIVVGLDPSHLHGDGSQASLHAAAYAAGVARREGARVVPVWVRPPVAIGQTFAATVDALRQGRDDREADVQRAVDEAAAQFGIPAPELVVREGDPFEELAAVADDVSADAIVVGSAEHRIGSLAVKLVRAARWPVTVVP
ncbi:MAG TPA: universal stress protein [Acidimicrobiales bacterium]|nr:universal stress protein [Acidimicrobiales bacterium]